jgi:hypothetical protein
MAPEVKIMANDERPTEPDPGPEAPTSVGSEESGQTTEQRVRSLEQERDRLLQAVKRLEEERDSYRDAAYAWARAQFPVDEREELPRFENCVPLAQLIAELEQQET